MDFRGGFAPASLKHRLGRPYVEGHASISGADSPRPH